MAASAGGLRAGDNRARPIPRGGREPQGGEFSAHRSRRLTSLLVEAGRAVMRVRSTNSPCAVTSGRSSDVVGGYGRLRRHVRQGCTRTSTGDSCAMSPWQLGIATAGPGQARPGQARQGKARQGQAGKGKTAHPKNLRLFYDNLLIAHWPRTSKFWQSPIESGSCTNKQTNRRRNKQRKNCKMQRMMLCNYK